MSEATLELPRTKAGTERSVTVLLPWYIARDCSVIQIDREPVSTNYLVRRIDWDDPRVKIYKLSRCSYPWKHYHVECGEAVYTCDCDAFQWKSECKHTAAVDMLRKTGFLP